MSKYTVEDWKRIMIDMCPVIYRGIVFQRVYQMQFTNVRDPHHPEAPVAISFDLVLMDRNRNSICTAHPADVEIWNESDRNRLFGPAGEETGDEAS